MEDVLSEIRSDAAEQTTAVTELGKDEIPKAITLPQGFIESVRVSIFRLASSFIEKFFTG